MDLISVEEVSVFWVLKVILYVLLGLEKIFVLFRSWILSLALEELFKHVEGLYSLLLLQFVFFVLFVLLKEKFFSTLLIKISVIDVV